MAKSTPVQSTPLLKTNTVNETCYQCHAEKHLIIG
jgi:doubled CXXCH motif protein